MRAALRRRWSDNDHNFGPFTYARDSRYRSWEIVVQSGDDEYPEAQFRITLGRRTFISAIPRWIIRPYREKVQAHWDAATVQRLGRDWYWKVDPRAYGVSLSDGFLNVRLGRQTHDSSTEQRWGYFLPWTQWRFVRHSYYGLNGEFLASLPDAGKGYRLSAPDRWEREQAIKNATPTISFEFDDFDGERIVAKTFIEERAWKFGTGWFKWLSAFRHQKVRRSLDIEFSKETGGTLGHGINLLPGELHEAAFRRYCAEHKMTFVAVSPPKERVEG